MPLAIYVGEEAEHRRLEELVAGKQGLARRAYPPTVTAALAGINEQTLRDLVADGTVTPYEERLGNQPLYTADEIEKIKQSRKKRGF